MSQSVGSSGVYQGPVYLAGSGGNPYRAIATIIADVTVREQGTDRQTITKHPVEQGAAITDHAYNEPSELALSIGFSDSGEYVGYINDAYAALLNLQASRTPFNVYTGKRVYNNMMMISVMQQTDEKTENVLMAQVMLSQIIIVSLATSALAPAAQQANPQDTAPAVNNGQQQLQQPSPQANVSILSKITGQGTTN